MHAQEGLRNRGTGSGEPPMESELETETEMDTDGESKRMRSVERAGSRLHGRISEEPTGPQPSKWEKMRTRTVMTAYMFTFMLTVFAAGHFYCAVLVMVLMGMIFKEILLLKRNKDKEMHLPFFFAIRWHFFAVTVLYFVRKFLQDRIERLAMNNQLLKVLFVSHHIFIVYTLMMLGIIMFVLSLRKFSYRYQFYQLGWTSVTLVMVVSQGSAQVANIYQGLIWFWIPASLVVANDSFAYFAGSFFGRTKLIALSPKKTVEGFTGGAIGTVIWGLWFCSVLQKYSQLTCPMNDFSIVPFEVLSLDCPAEGRAIFVSDQQVFLPAWLGEWSFTVSRMQIHTFYMALVASLVAPFGGFFASGFKRAFKIKDFGDLIPGHGGVTDRLDCHIVMGMFVYVYMQQFVLDPTIAQPSANDVVNQALKLSAEDQAKVLEMLAAQNP